MEQNISWEPKVAQLDKELCTLRGTPSFSNMFAEAQN
jgi:hypothetical protein